MHNPVAAYILNCILYSATMTVYTAEYLRLLVVAQQV